MRHFSKVLSLNFESSCLIIVWFGSSVVTVAGICNSVDGGVFFDMPPRCRW